MGFLAEKRIPDHRPAVKHSIAYGIAKGLPSRGRHAGFHLPERTFQGSCRQVCRRVRQRALVFPATWRKTPRSSNCSSTWRSTGKASTASCIRSPTRRAKPSKAISSTASPRRLPHRARHFVLQLSGAGEAARPMLLKGNNAALLALSYLGAERTMPKQHHGSAAKASLEATTVTWPFCLGPQGIRVTPSRPARSRRWRPESAISASCWRSIRTSRRCRNVTIDEVGNVAAFMLSDLASGITGEITYVDGGLNTTALGRGPAAGLRR